MCKFNWEVHEKKWPQPVFYYYPSIQLKGQRKPWRPSVMILCPQSASRMQTVLLFCELKRKKGEFVFYTCYVIFNCFVHLMIIKQLFCSVNDRNINAFDTEMSLFLHTHPLSIYLQMPCCQSSFISGCS